MDKQTTLLLQSSISRFVLKTYLRSDELNSHTMESESPPATEPTHQQTPMTVAPTSPPLQFIPMTAMIGESSSSKHTDQLPIENISSSPLVRNRTHGVDLDFHLGMGNNYGLTFEERHDLSIQNALSLFRNHNDRVNPLEPSKKSQTLFLGSNTDPVVIPHNRRSAFRPVSPGPIQKPGSSVTRFAPRRIPVQATAIQYQRRSKLRSEQPRWIPRKRNEPEIVKEGMGETQTEQPHHTVSTQPSVLDKGKQQVGNSDIPLLTRFNLFSCKEACLASTRFMNRSMITTKGFHWKALLAFPQFAHTAAALGWNKLCEVPLSWNIDWVRDFYSEQAVSNGCNILVRKTLVSFSQGDINKLLGLNNYIDNSYFDSLIETNHQKQLDKILAAIALEGSTWSYNGHMRFLKTHCLKPEANVWFHFLRHSVYPTTHDGDLYMVRCVILYFIMEKIKFNVGRVISDDILRGASRANSKLRHPAIIHALMAKARVPKLIGDRYSNEQVAITKLNIERLMRNNLPVCNARELGGLTPFEVSLKTLKDEMLGSIQENNVFFELQVLSRGDHLVANVEWLTTTVMEMQEDLKIWFKFEKDKEDAERERLETVDPGALRKRPQFPLGLLWRNAARPPTRH